MVSEYSGQNMGIQAITNHYHPQPHSHEHKFKQRLSMFTHFQYIISYEQIEPIIIAIVFWVSSIFHHHSSAGYQAPGTGSGRIWRHRDDSCRETVFE